MKILDHNELFRRPEYIEQFENKKRRFENMASDERVQEVAEWTKTPEYMEKNFERKNIKINPAKACQPLGALLCAGGFEKTLPFCQGAQGCVAYFRSHLSRHFKEPSTAVSSSMTEDAAVFGGLNNMLDGLDNAYTIYKPEMMAVFTSCIAEVIGDDLNAYSRNAHAKGLIPEEMPIALANTPSFVGSHIVGYDNMLKAILTTLTKGKKGDPNHKLNVIMGFDTYTGDYREVARMLNIMGVDHTLLADISDVYDSPTNGKFELYPGGTKLADAADSVNAAATIALQRYSTKKTMNYIKKEWVQKTEVVRPIGIRGTDMFLDEVSKMMVKRIPQELEDERGRAVDAMIDSHPYVHGKRFALVGDPDLLIGLIEILMEMGAYPAHIIATNGDKKFEAEANEVLSQSPFGAQGKVLIGKDMWHLRSLLFNEPVDYLIGNTYAKFLQRDVGTPLIRIGFPIFDRHHLHRYPIVGYQGALNIVTMIVNMVLDEMDRETMYTTSFDAIR